MDPFVGEIRLLPFSYAPSGWALCNGQILPIQGNTTLFSIIGVTYGGNGTTNFQLPNLQGQVMPGFGSGPGLSPWDLGEQNGSDTASLDITQIPAHNHTVTGLNNPATAAVADATTYLAHDVRGGGVITYMAPLGGTVALDTALSPLAVGVTGSNVPHANQQPFLPMNFCIALSGVFPARN